MKTRALIVTGYGVNADEELAAAFVMAGADATRMHAADLIQDPSVLASYQYLGFPGGFSFGDHLGSGLVAANLFRSRMGTELKAFVADGGMVIGICNGFQTLVKTGLLPNFDDKGEPVVSLVHNNHGRYEDNWVSVRFEEGPCVWTSGLGPRMLPIRHGEGRFVAKDQGVLDRLESEHLVALRYDGINPNGAVHDIAGICDKSGRVLGMMPHPEAFINADAHPYRRRGFDGGLGLEVFQKAVAWKTNNM